MILLVNGLVRGFLASAVERREVISGMGYNMEIRPEGRERGRCDVAAPV